MEVNGKRYVWCRQCGCERQVKREATFDDRHPEVAARRKNEYEQGVIPF
jgi:hypothetical protein